jgi:hypothetical protein
VRAFSPAGALAGGAKFMPGMGLVAKAAVLSGGQMEVPGAGCERVDKEPAGRRVDC